MKPNLGQVVRELLLDHREGEVEVTLLKMGAKPCVAREWANEHFRREALARKARKIASQFGRRGESYRRIINVIKIPSRTIAGTQEMAPGRELQFHATKGWRNYRSEV